LPHRLITRVTLRALPLALGLAACTHDATSPDTQAAVSPMRAQTITISGSAEPSYVAGAAPLIWRDNFDSVTTDAAMLAKYATLSANFMHHDATGGLSGSGAARIDWKASTSCADDSRVLEKDFAAPAKEDRPYEVHGKRKESHDALGRVGLALRFHE